MRVQCEDNDGDDECFFRIEPPPGAVVVTVGDNCGGQVRQGAGGQRGHGAAMSRLAVARLLPGHHGMDFSVKGECLSRVSRV